MEETINEIYAIVRVSSLVLYALVGAKIAVFFSRREP